ncbi:hypothetical protein LEP1GSC079_0659 [Leptospira interrogans str. FPW1039]|uniref:Uncharacterized protein n=1 Tax=Leptospira interrogans str. FPW1039 TaxID=1193040 RepID=A0A0F6ICQ4_LEPIR|nr:hypothetical protein LEP1GSC079_0659 [Leptospira interrogans str. FPW1039]
MVPFNSHSLPQYLNLKFLYQSKTLSNFKIERTFYRFQNRKD